MTSGALRWFVIFFVAVNVLVWFWRDALVRQRRENLLWRGQANGQAAAPVRRDSTGQPVVGYDWSAGEELGAYWRYVPDGRREPLVVVAGMSQMYAINEPRAGDRTIAEWLDESLAPHGVRAFGLAAPNLDNEEALFLLVATLSDERTLPTAFIYGVCFDKFRNVDLRPGYRAFMAGRPALQRLWATVAKGAVTRHPLAAAKMDETLQEARKLTREADSDIEGRLRSFVARWLPIVSARQELNAQAQIQLYLLRNWVFGIKPTSKRPIIQSRYALNQDFLRLMIDVARANRVTLALYVVPLNPLAENPYVPVEYEEFKRWFAGLCHDERVPFADLEGAVEAGEWGQFLGGPDFKHFKGEGHRITSQTLISAFGPLLLPQKKAGGSPR